MRRFFTSLVPKWPWRLRRPGMPELVCAALALACLILPEWWALSRNRVDREKELRDLLSVQLEGAQDALQAWAADLRSEVVARASDPEVRRLVALAAAPEGSAEGTQRDANRSLLNQTLNTLQGPSERFSSRFDGFVAVAPGGRVVADSLGQRVGALLPLPQGSVLRLALQGETALNPLGTHDLNLVLDDAERESCILAAVPVRDSEGRVLAALAFRFRVRNALQGLITARNGRGPALEAYSSSGAWVTNTNPRQGRLGDSPATSPAVGDLLARIWAGDTGLPSMHPPALLHERPFFNVDGYGGLDGQWVVGAAAAVPEIGVGLLVELDSGAAYRSVRRSRWTLIGLAMILGFGLLLAILNQTSAGGAVAAPMVRSSARNTAAWAILGVSVLATGVTWWATKSKVEQYDRTRFEQEAERIRDDLLGRIDRYAELLRSVSASFEAFGTMQPAEWDDFVGSLNLSETFPGFGYLAFIERVPAEQAPQLTGAAPASLVAPYAGYAPGSGPRRFSILCVAPVGPSRNPVGFDLGSSTALRAVLERARDTGETALSGIVEETALSGGETGLLMLDPVYRAGAETETRSDRREALVGWVAAFVRSSEMIKNLASSSLADIDLEVFDGAKLDRRYLLYDQDGTSQNEIERNSSRFQQALRVDVGGHPWTLFFSSISGFDLPITQNHPAQVLVGGLAISVLLFDIALVLSSTRSRALAIAELMTHKVRESEGRVRAVIDCALDGIITFDETGHVHTFNPAAERLFGRSAAEAQGVRIEDLLLSHPRPSSDHTAGVSPWARHLMQGPGRECMGRRKDGATFPAELTISRLQTTDRILYTAIVRDISERKAAEEALRESEARYALAARAANDGLWDWNLRTDSIYYSPRWKAMLGIEDSAVVDTPEVWFHRVHEDDQARLQANLKEHLEGITSHFESEYRAMHRDGSYRWMLSRGIAVRDDSGRPIRVAGSQTDITARKQAERQLLYDALHDPLTGLPNRNYFMGQLERAAKEGSRRGTRTFGILFLDIDRFKLVNDSLGHLIGDQLLVAIADRLKICLRPGDTIARLGGDEFAVLVEAVNSVDDATHIAERIQSELELPFRVADQDVFTSASIGIALNRPARGSAEDLLRDADTAMYRAKAQGRARYQLFTQGMHTRAVDFLRMETALRRALERDELRVHYQPIVSLETGEITSCEALIRWQHPERGLILPGEFVSLAEETGLIVPMSAWLMRTACTQVKAWQAAGLPSIRLAVNISPRQLTQENLFQTVSHVLFATGLGPDSLELELTESALMESTEQTIKPLVELSARGVQISLDDFGTGYSSLVYLRRFPISKLKIDSSFVRDIITDVGDAAIASGLIALAHSLDLRVTAEGVETMEQLEFLRRRKCDDVQGHVISPPLDAVRFTEMLRNGIDSKLFSSAPGA